MMLIISLNNHTITYDIFIYTLIIAITILAVLPVIGTVINTITSGIFKFLFGLFDKSNRFFVFFANVFTWPGVVIHELSHALWVILTGAKIVHISLYHHENDHLGSVTYISRGNLALQAIQKAFISSAPVFMGFGVEAALLFIMHSTTLPLWGSIACIYIFISVLIHMDMSRQDISCYLKGIPVCFIIIYIIVLLFFLVNPDTYLELHNLFNSRS